MDDAVHIQVQSIHRTHAVRRLDCANNPGIALDKPSIQSGNSHPYYPLSPRGSTVCFAQLLCSALALEARHEVPRTSSSSIAMNFLRFAKKIIAPSAQIPPLFRLRPSTHKA